VDVVKGLYIGMIIEMLLNINKIDELRHPCASRDLK
jgi:hypothetical protein